MGRKTSVLTNACKDGSILAAAMAVFGIGPIRSSSFILPSLGSRMIHYSAVKSVGEEHKLFSCQLFRTETNVRRVHSLGERELSFKSLPAGKQSHHRGSDEARRLLRTAEGWCGITFWSTAE